MCAAPGSKTTQLIEMLHADMNVPFPGMHWPGGLEVVATLLWWDVDREKLERCLKPP